MRLFFKIISILFHPLFVMMYMMFIIVAINPYLFRLTDHKSQVLLYLAVFFTSILLPLVAIIMMRFLGFMASLEMRDAKERIGPLIVVAVCYIWLYLNIRMNNAVPSAFSMFVLGSIISLFLAFFINNFEKISLHTTALAGMVMGLIIIANMYGQSFINLDLGRLGSISFDSILLIVASVFILGLVSTGRLYLQQHNLREVMGGIIVGMVGQVFALNLVT